MKFFKTFLASTLGTLLAIFILFIIGFIMIISSSKEPEPYIRDNTVLKLNISGNIPGRTIINPFDEFIRKKIGDHVSLESLKKNLKKAAVDDHIKGVWLNINFVSAPWSTLQEANTILENFKKNSGKFIYASTDDQGLNEKGYFLATSADSIFSPPASFFEFDGFYTQTTFYKKLLDKVGVKAEITRKGKYKSAVEPFMRTDNSEASDYQLRQIVDKISSVFVNQISEKTGKSADEINGMLNTQPHINADFAYQNGLINGLIYPEEVENKMKKRMGVSAEDELETISNSRYLKVSNESAGLTTPDTKNKIAVLYADGMIVSQSPTESPLQQEQFITANSIRKELQSIREDDQVKALVVRINSPGGSGSTSDLIWHMLRQTSEDVPVIASMGPVAASGGYYMAMAADTIVAMPTTITGSIGVFGTKFNAKDLLNDKIGLTFDEVKSHKHADWLNPTRPFSPDEAEAFQRDIDKFYETFITKVAERRGLTRDQVDERAQGRVWIGSDAKNQQLVDLLGDLDEAVSVAAKKANIDQYKLVSYPKPKSFYELLMNSAETQVQSLFSMHWLFGSYTKEMEQALNTHERGVMSLMPYKISVH